MTNKMRSNLNKCIIPITLGLMFFSCLFILVHKKDQISLNTAAHRSPRSITSNKKVGLDSGLMGNRDSMILWAEKNSRGRSPDSAGLKLAKKRGEFMSQLIRTDPQGALDASLPLHVYLELPEEIQNLIEKPFSTSASLGVAIFCGDTSHEMEYNVKWDGITRRAYFAGDRQGMMSKDRVSISGVEIGNVAAVRTNPVWVMKDEEIPAAAELFKTPAPTGSGTTAMVGGKFVLAALTELNDISDQMSAAEMSVNPASELEPAAANMTNSLSSPALTVKAKAAWTLTDKKVLFLNLVFSDSSGPVITKSTLQNNLAAVSNTYNDMSYGKTKFSQVVVPDALTLPHPLSYYNNTNGTSQLRDDALVAAANQGIITSGNVEDWKSQYDMIGFIFPKVNAFSFSGLGEIGGRHVWINGQHSLRVFIHEFGHDYGLYHASSWNEHDPSKIPPTPPTANNLSVNTSIEPRHIEYGDVYDYMGNVGDFGVMEKNRLWWIDDSKIVYYENGSPDDITYRIYSFDEPLALTKPLLGIRAQVQSTETFWICYRGNHANALAHNGAHIVWQFEPEQARLLDMTPENTATYDVILPIGQTYTDPSGNLSITPLAKGGVNGREWLDVRIVSGTVGNNPPSVALKVSPTNPVAGETVRLSATGSDPDGDPIIYHWDFGDGQKVDGTSKSLTHIYPLGGTFNVTVAADDGKGGYTEKTFQIDIPEPLLSLATVSTPNSGTANTVIATGNKAFSLSNTKLYAGPLNGPLELVSSIPDGSMLDLATDGTTVVMVGTTPNYFAIMYSTSVADPTVLTKESLPPFTKYLSGIVYANGIWVAVGNEGTILTKSGSGAWIKRTSTATNIIADVAYNNGTFMAISYDRGIYTSTDGINWTEKNSPPSAGYYMYKVEDCGIGFCVKWNGNFAFTGDQGQTWHVYPAYNFDYKTAIWTGSAIAVIGQRKDSFNSPYVPVLLGSVDGINWSSSPYPAFASASDMILQGENILLVGTTPGLRYGVRVEAPIPAPPTAKIFSTNLPDSAQLDIDSTPGQVFDIFRSEDLTSGFGSVPYESDVPASQTGQSTIYTDFSPLPSRGFYRIERTTN